MNENPPDDERFELAWGAWRQFFALHLDHPAPSQPEIDARLIRYRRAHEALGLARFGAALALAAGIAQALSISAGTVPRLNTAAEVLVLLFSGLLLVALAHLAFQHARAALEHRTLAQRIDVEPFVLTGGGEEVTHCAICGLVLDNPEEEQQAERMLKCIAIAEDSDSVRQVVARTLSEQKIAAEVIEAQNGVEFVGQVTARLREGKPLSLAILDVEMPMMNGVQAAKSLREVEKQLGVRRKTPILFFTSRKIDDRLKGILQKLQPSSYVNKGTSSDPAQLAERVNRVLGVLLAGKAPART
jgi:CheY-like chemotaxis protein